MGLPPACRPRAARPVSRSARLAPCSARSQTPGKEVKSKGGSLEPRVPPSSWVTEWNPNGPARVAGQLQTHVERLWEHSGVPSWHKTLYTARYLRGGYGYEILQREAQALAAGKAPVQLAMRAVEAREDLLSKLTDFRSQHLDTELRQRRSSARGRLLALLLALRSATVEAVLAISAWRRSVAPLLPHGSEHTASHDGSQATTPGGATRRAGKPVWPFGLEGTDYLQRVACDDLAVRAFAAVVELAPKGNFADPLFLYLPVVPPARSTTSTPRNPSHKLRLPPAEPSESRRIEQARMLLVEEEVAWHFAGNIDDAGQHHVDLLVIPNWPPGGGRSSVLSFRPDSPASQQNEDQPAVSVSEDDGDAKDFKERPIFRRKLTPLYHHAATVDSGLLELQASAADSVASSESLGEPGNHDQVSRIINPMVEMAAAHSQKTHESAVSTRRPSISISSPESSPPTSRTSTSTPTGRRNSATTLARRGSGELRSPSTGPHRTSATQRRHSVTQRISVRAKQKGKQFPLRSSSAIDDMDQGMPEVDPIRIEAAFKRFAHDGQLHHDEIRDAVQRSGFARPDEDLLEEVYKEVTSFSTINGEEFFSVVWAYEARQRQCCLELFSGANLEGENGALNAAQTADVLRRMDLDPMPHVLAEVIAEVDENADGQVNFREFYRLVVLLRERETFTCWEYQELLDVFKKFDTLGCAEMDTKDFSRALMYIGFGARIEEVGAFVDEVDADRNGRVDQTEFLFCMRRVRDCELDHVRKCMAAADTDESGTISVSEMPDLLDKLGYFLPDEQIVSDVFDEVQDRMEIPETGELEIGGVWQFLCIYRMREGLSREEAAEVEEAFKRFAGQDGEDAQEVSKRSLPKVLYCLGYRTSFEQQLLLAAEVDIDGSGTLCLRELLKLVRMLREQRFQAITAAFHRFDTSDTGSLSALQVEAALESLAAFWTDGGVHLEDVPIKYTDSDSRVGLKAFVRIALRLDEAMRLQCRESEGYSPEEMMELEEHFKDFDPENTGAVPSADIIGLVMASSPDLATDMRLRSHILTLVRQAVDDGTGKFGFSEFLQLMRAVREAIQREENAREREAMEQSGFSPSEVHQFRTIFLSFANEQKRLPRQTFQELLAPLCPSGGRAAAALTGIWHRQFMSEASKGPTPSASEVRSGEEADFPQFLLLMRAVLDANLGNVVTGNRHSLLERSPQDNKLRPPLHHSNAVQGIHSMP